MQRRRSVLALVIGLMALASVGGASVGASTPPPGPTTTVPPTPLMEFSGTGADVVDLGVALTDVHIVDFTHAGQSNFIVEAVDELFEPYELLVNEIGPYAGRHIINLHDDDVTRYIQVDADGAWTIKVFDLLAADVWLGGEVHGVGATVVVFVGTPGIVEYAYVGAGNFVVRSVGDSGLDLLVNEIDSVEGSTLLADSPAIVIVEAVGEWWLNVG